LLLNWGEILLPFGGSLSGQVGITSMTLKQRSDGMGTNEPKKELHTGLKAR